MDNESTKATNNAVIVREARPKQSLSQTFIVRDCFATLAMTAKGNANKSDKSFKSHENQSSDNYTKSEQLKANKIHFQLSTFNFQLIPSVHFQLSTFNFQLIQRSKPKIRSQRVGIKLNYNITV
jgi:hypothetical protein